MKDNAPIEEHLALESGCVTVRFADNDTQFSLLAILNTLLPTQILKTTDSHICQTVQNQG